MGAIFTVFSELLKKYQKRHTVHGSNVEHDLQYDCIHLVLYLAIHFGFHQIDLNNLNHFKVPLEKNTNPSGK